MLSSFNGFTNHPIYSAEHDLRVIEHGGKRVVVNPELGAWAVVSRQELIQLMNPTGCLAPELGESAYRHGLARKNGHSVYDSSAQSDKLFLFEFAVSGQCNLACVYCSAATLPSKRIPPTDPELGKLWVDRVVEYCTRHGLDRIELEFTGGEPLANVDFLASTVAYAQQRFAEPRIRANFTVVSNLTLLGVRQLEFLQRFPIDLNVSLDGDEEDHDAQRPFAAGRGSYRAVRKNLAKLARSGLAPRTIQSTITRRNVDRLPSIAKRLLDMGFTQLSLHRMNPGGVLSRDPFPLIPDAKDYVDRLFETFERVYLPFWRATGVMPHSRYLGLAYAYLLEPKRSYMCQRSPCGAGRTIIAVDAKGDVYGCAIAPWTKDFRYGNIRVDSFEDCRRSAAAAASSARHFRDLPGCAECLFRGWCQGGCPKDAFAAHGTIAERSGACAFYRELWRRALYSLVDEVYPPEAVQAVARSYLR